MKYIFIVSFCIFFSKSITAQDKVYRSFKEAFSEPEKVKILNIDPLNQTKEIINGIEHFDNTKMEIIKSLPNEIKNLKNLKKLILTNFDFKVFPEILFELENLEFLGLDCCNIDSIPLGITRLIKLKQLNLSHNKLQTIPSFIGNLSLLKGLDFSGNLITDLPMEIGKLKNLTCFESDYNVEAEYHCPIPISVLSIDSIQRLFLFADQEILKSELNKISNLKNLKELHLFLKNVDKFPNELFELTNLEILQISSDKLISLPDDFKKLKNLRDLFFRNHPGEFSYDDQKKIRELLPNCKEIDI